MGRKTSNKEYTFLWAIRGILPGVGTGDVAQDAAVGGHEVQHLVEHALQALGAGAQECL